MQGVSVYGLLGFTVWEFYSLLQQPGPKKFKLSKIELIYKARKFKVPPFTIKVYRVSNIWLAALGLQGLGFECHGLRVEG